LSAKLLLPGFARTHACSNT